MTNKQAKLMLNHLTMQAVTSGNIAKANRLGRAHREVELTDALPKSNPPLNEWQGDAHTCGMMEGIPVV